MHTKTETAIASGLNFAFYSACAYRVAGALSVGMLFSTMVTLASWRCHSQGQGSFHSKRTGWKHSIARIATLTVAPSMVLGGAALVSIATFGGMGRLHG